MLHYNEVHLREAPTQAFGTSARRGREYRRLSPRVPMINRMLNQTRGYAQLASEVHHAPPANVSNSSPQRKLTGVNEAPRGTIELAMHDFRVDKTHAQSFNQRMRN